MGRLPDTLSQFIVPDQRQTGQTHSHQPVFLKTTVDKIERHHRPMVQCSFPHAFRPGRQPPVFCQCTQFFRKLHITIRCKRYLFCMETAKVSLCRPARGYMEIVRVHNLMRGNDHNRIRTALFYIFRYFLICLCRLVNLSLFSSADLRYDQRRMGNHICRCNSHATVSSCYLC